MKKKDLALRVLSTVLESHERMEVSFEGKNLVSIQVRNLEDVDRISELAGFLGHSFSKKTLGVVPYAEFEIQGCLISLHC